MSFFEEKNPEMDRYLEAHASSEADILKKLRRDLSKNNAAAYDFGISAGKIAHNNFPDAAAEECS
jgi:hypothetical protein